MPPPCHDYNPAPPAWPQPGTIYSFPNAAPGLLARDFIAFYHAAHFGSWLRPGAAATDSVMLTSDQVNSIRGDAEVMATELGITQTLISLRVWPHIARLNCDETGCFTDAGMTVTITDPHGPASYALGRFSIYWTATCTMGPRRCELDIDDCPPGQGSSADYELKINWRLYDVYDFTGWQNIIPFSWGGTDFRVFGDWQTVHRGTVTSCAAPPDRFDSIECQQDLGISTYYDILYAWVRPDAEPPFDRDAVVDSAMGRLLGDGKAWCGTASSCRNNRVCHPIFSFVNVVIGSTSTRQAPDGLKQCLVRVFVTARVKCRCLRAIEAPFPRPASVGQLP